MDPVAFETTTAEVLENAEAGDLAACERLLIDLLALVRGHDVDQELRTLSNLAAIYNRSGRRVESLMLARRGVELARSAGNKYYEARGLTGVCNGRHGLRIEADVGDELERLRELMAEFPIRENTLLLHTEVAFIKFAHAIQGGDLLGAREHIERFHEMASQLPRDQALTRCVHLAGVADIKLRAGDIAGARMLLKQLHENEEVAPFLLPEITVRRVEASIAAGDPVSARREADDAIRAIDHAPPIARAECIHFGGQLAEVLATTLDDVDAATRVYDTVATAVFERIRQVDACTDSLPELVMSLGDYQQDLVRYRKSFVTQQKAVMARVAEMFHAQEASGLERFLVGDVDEQLVAICAWCESVRGGDGRWIGVGHLVPREGLAITHGICPRCAASMSSY